MVYFFQSVADPSFTIYMGKHKEENEVLLRYMWPEDVWFHVDDHSSAHVYLRLKPNQTLDDIPKQVLIECCQLCKANSIKGNKLDDVTIIYTNFLNLRKEAHMEPGEVGFHDEKAVRRAKVSTRNNSLLRQLDKTKEERFPDLRKEREERDAEEQRQKEHLRREAKRSEAEEKKALKSKAIEQAALREYKDIFANDDAKALNSDNKAKTAAELEEDFW